MPTESAISAGSRKPSDCAATCQSQKVNAARRGRLRRWSSAARPTDTVATMQGRYRQLAYSVTSRAPLGGIEQRSITRSSDVKPHSEPQLKTRGRLVAAAEVTARERYCSSAVRQRGPFAGLLGLGESRDCAL